MQNTLKSMMGFLLRLFGSGSESVEQDEQLLEDFVLDLATQTAHLPEKLQPMKIVLLGDEVNDEGAISGVPLPIQPIPEEEQNQPQFLFLEEWCAANPDLADRCSFHPRTNEIRIQR